MGPPTNNWRKRLDQTNTNNVNKTWALLQTIGISCYSHLLTIANHKAQQKSEILNKWVWNPKI